MELGPFRLLQVPGLARANEGSRSAEASKRKLPKPSSPRFLPARAVRTRKSGHPSCGSSWCSVSGCCLTSPGLLDYWETTFSMFPYSTLSLVRFWIHAHASVYASFGTAPLYLAVACSTLSVPEEYSFAFFWEMASGFVVFSASRFDSGYMYCQSTRAWIFHVEIRGFTRFLRSRFSSCSPWFCRGAEADSQGLAVARWFMSQLCRSSRFFVPDCVKTVETWYSCLDKFVVSWRRCRFPWSRLLADHRDYIDKVIDVPVVRSSKFECSL